MSETFPPAAAPQPQRWLLVDSATGEPMNEILWDGVSPFTPPPGQHLQPATT